MKDKKQQKPSKENIQHFRQDVFSNFLFFGGGAGDFCLLGTDPKTKTEFPDAKQW
jgi:hypothetical protein